MPLLSIITAAYNAESTLRETLDSVLRQTERDWELILVDDGSTDATIAIAREYADADPRIIAISQANAGTAAARNVGAALARAPWVMSLDADDLLLDCAVGSQLEFIAGHPSYEAFTWGHSLLAEDGSLTQLPEEWGLGTAHEYSIMQVALARIVPCCSVWWSRDLFQRLGGYRVSFTEDYELILRAALTGVRVFHNPQICELYRIRSESRSHARAGELTNAIIAVSRQAVAEFGAPPEVERAIERRNKEAAHDLRVTLSQNAREAFVDAEGGPDATRKLYLGALDRPPTFKDRWLWLAPAAMLTPRTLSRFLARRGSSPSAG